MPAVAHHSLHSKAFVFFLCIQTHNTSDVWMRQTILPLSPLLVNKQNLKYRYIFCCFLTQTSFSQGAGDPLAAALRHGATLRCCHRQKWAAARTCMPTGVARRRITTVHACVLAPDAWLTTVTVHYTVNALSAGELFALSLLSNVSSFSLFLSWICFAPDICS